jgi:hypothetical protein
MSGVNAGKNYAHPEYYLSFIQSFDGAVAGLALF